MMVCLRILIGLVLLVSGFEKVISPYQNFQYVIQAYQLFPSILEQAAAITVPWVELLVGLFMVLGLWLNWTLKGSLLLFASFIVIVGQALLRHLDIDHCGCFGSWIQVSPQQIIVFDSFMLLLNFLLIRNLAKARGYSLDQAFK